MTSCDVPVVPRRWSPPPRRPLLARVGQRSDPRRRQRPRPRQHHGAASACSTSPTCRASLDVLTGRDLADQMRCRSPPRVPAAAGGHPRGHRQRDRPAAVAGGPWRPSPRAAAGRPASSSSTRPRPPPGPMPRAWPASPTRPSWFLAETGRARLAEVTDAVVQLELVGTPLLGAVVRSPRITVPDEPRPAATVGRAGRVVRPDTAHCGRSHRTAAPDLDCRADADARRLAVVRQLARRPAGSRARLRVVAAERSGEPSCGTGRKATFPSRWLLVASLGGLGDRYVRQDTRGGTAVARGLSDPQETRPAPAFPVPRRTEWPYVGVVIATRDRPNQVRRALASVGGAGLPRPDARGRGLRRHPRPTGGSPAAARGPSWCWRTGGPARAGRGPQHRHPRRRRLRAGRVLRRRRHLGAERS